MITVSALPTRFPMARLLEGGHRFLVLSFSESADMLLHRNCGPHRLVWSQSIRDSRSE